MKARTLYVALAASACFAAAQSKTLPLADVNEIKRHPMRYDGKEVRVGGWLIARRHGVSLLNEDRDSALGIRSAAQVPSMGKRERQDALLKQFWNVFAARETMDVATEQRHAEFIEQ